MSISSPSALITDRGQRVLLRLQGRFFELSQPSLRDVLGLPDGPAGLGITVKGDRLRFEFPEDRQCVELTAKQLHRRLTKQRARSKGA